MHERRSDSEIHVWGFGFQDLVYVKAREWREVSGLGVGVRRIIVAYVTMRRSVKTSKV